MGRPCLHKGQESALLGPGLRNHSGFSLYCLPVSGNLGGVSSVLFCLCSWQSCCLVLGSNSQGLCPVWGTLLEDVVHGSQLAELLRSRVLAEGLKLSKLSACSVSFLCGVSSLLSFYCDCGLEQAYEFHGRFYEGPTLCLAALLAEFKDLYSHLRNPVSSVS